MLWPDSLLDHIVSKTNLYARTHQNIDDFKNLSAVTKAEMYTYFSIMLGMCITGKPMMKEHWMHDKLVGTEWIYKKMSRNRWMAIHRALNFDITEVERQVQKASKLHWNPLHRVCINEGMMPWLGRKKKLRVFIPGKPHLNGIKI